MAYQPLHEKTFDVSSAFQAALERTYGRDLTLAMQGQIDDESIYGAYHPQKSVQQPKKKEYTARERHMYHQARSDAARAGETKAGVRYGDPRYCYSVGFTHGYWWGKNDVAMIKNKFGEQAARAYMTGLARGKQALQEEFNSQKRGKK